MNSISRFTAYCERCMPDEMILQMVSRTWDVEMIRSNYRLVDCSFSGSTVGLEHVT